MADLEAPGGFEASIRLNVTNLQARWEGRRRSQAPYLMAELFGSVAWFSLIGPIACLCDLLGGESRSATKIVSSAFTAVAMLTLVDLTFQAGTISLVDWVSTWPPIRDADEHHASDGGFGALQALEIAFMVGESRTTWCGARTAAAAPPLPPPPPSSPFVQSLQAHTSARLRQPPQEPRGLRATISFPSLS